MVKVFYHKILSELNQVELNHYLKDLPEVFQRKVLNYHHLEDQYRSLFSLKLLEKACISYGFERDIMQKIKFNNFGRPYLETELDFNISHSGKYVICVISNCCRLGVDIEKIRPIRLADFKNIMTQSQMEIIRYSNDPINLFFRYWTIKEAAVKGDGRGMSIPLDKIETDFNIVNLFFKKWYIKELKFGSGYSSHFVTDKPIGQSILIEIDSLKSG